MPLLKAALAIAGAVVALWVVYHFVGFIISILEWLTTCNDDDEDNHESY